MNLVQEAGCLSNIAGISSSDSEVFLVVVEFKGEKRKAGPFIAPASISTPHEPTFEAAEPFRFRHHQGMSAVVSNYHQHLSPTPSLFKNQAPALY